MRVVVSLEQVYQRTPDGRIWTQAMFGAGFFARYLRVFDGVTIAARVRDVPTLVGDWQAVEGPGIAFAPLPFYHGPLAYLRRQRELRRAALAAVDPQAALILRVASPIAGLMGRAIRSQRHPFACEVVCDPWDVFGPQGVRHLLRPYLRWHFTRQMRQQCATACAVAYVTERTLQHRYPTAANAPSFGVSDVELSPAAFVDQPRAAAIDGPFRVLLVGSLAQLYKGPDVLLRALARCVGSGLDVHGTFIGDGQFRGQIETLAQELGLTARCRFLGQLSAGTAVRAELDRADLFVLPSRTEGLPRALVEAMARGLSCVASAVGGIPELLPADCLVQPGDDQALATAISVRARDGGRRMREGSLNLARARDFADHRLDAKRLAFYRAVHDATAAWSGTRQ